MMPSISFIILLLIMIMIPTILYTLFFIIKCPPNPFELSRRRRSTDIEYFDPRSCKMEEENEENEKNSNRNKNKIGIVIGWSSKLGKDEECPVCLSAYTEGEELRQLKYCKHMFHRSCIDKWLSTHCNCPVCRAFVVNQFKFSKDRESRVLPPRHDLWQGLPDSAGLL